MPAGVRKRTRPVGTILDQNDYRHEIGIKYGTLTVISFADFKTTPSKRKVPRVNCLCECGATKAISIWDLHRKATTTCGDRTFHKGYEDRTMPAFNNIYRNSYRNRATKAGLEFSITEEEFRTLSQQTCHYCGTLPEATSLRGTMRGTCKTGKGVSTFVYNGLDRMDSAKGYTLDNVVPCCGTCNHAKHTMGYTVFIAWLDRLVAYRHSRTV